MLRFHDISLRKSYATEEIPATVTALRGEMARGKYFVVVVQGQTAMTN